MVTNMISFVNILKLGSVCYIITKKEEYNRMKKKRWKIILSTIVLLLALFTGYIYFCIPIQLNGNYPEGLKPLSPDTLLTKEQVIEDRTQAIKFIEDVHPYFALEKDQSAYATALQKYMNATETEMYVSDFQAATAEYLCFFADGHTHIWWDEEAYLLLEQIYQDGKTYLAEGNSITDIWITEIGSVDIDTIYETINRVFPAENDMAVAINRNKYIIGKNLLTLAGAQIVDNHVTITFSDGSSDEYTFYQLEQSPIHPYEWQPNSWHMEDDIFVVDFHECVDDDNLKEIASELENAIRQGCTKVIIDVRGNGGGNSNACVRLLNAMGMEPPQYDIFIRYSPEAKEQLGYLRKNGTFRHHAAGDGKPNEAIELVVLSDRYTFSSATMLCVFVKDGNLGTLIGEPSSNMPSNYGDILYLSLPNSHLFGCVSHKQFIRPNGDTKSRQLLPDIQTSADEAYKEAIAYLHKQ